MSKGKENRRKTFTNGKSNDVTILIIEWLHGSFFFSVVCSSEVHADDESPLKSARL